LTRAVLEESRIHGAIRERIARLHRDVIDEVEAAVRERAVVVVGKKANPFPRKARQLLYGLGVAHRYLEYGGYLSQWRRRNVLKMWTGWPTFPMVYVKGALVATTARPKAYPPNLSPHPF
jgi:glutaredoxin-related protein